MSMDRFIARTIENVPSAWWFADPMVSSLSSIVRERHCLTRLRRQGKSEKSEAEVSDNNDNKEKKRKRRRRRKTRRTIRRTTRSRIMMHGNCKQMAQSTMPAYSENSCVSN